MNFLMVCSKPNEWDSNARRVAIHCTLDDNYAGPRVRSMLIFNASKALDCSNFRMLRVLGCWGEDMEFQSFKGAPCLRYLKLSTIIKGKETQFGEWVKGMKYLETLDLLNSSHGDLPDWIWHSKTLRHVLFSRIHSLSYQGPPASVELENLQTLREVSWNKSWEISGSPNISNLRELSIEIEGGISESAVSSFIGRQKHLFNLRIVGDVLVSRKTNWGGLQCYKNLQSLRLYRGNYDDETLLTLGDNMLPPNLIELWIYGYEFGSDPMAVLENLESLKYLSLVGKFVRNENTMRRMRIRCSSGGFKQLEHLVLEGLSLDEWEIEPGAMPMLKQLQIRACGQLRVPHELTHLAYEADLID